MTVAEILENVKDIYSDVLSKDVLKALGVEKRSESELTQRLRYSLRDGSAQAAIQGSMGALEGATVENHAGIYAAQREKLAGWADGKPRSAEAVRELLGESMTPTLEKWLHNQYEKGQNRQVKEPVRREAVEAFLKRDEEQIAANEEKSKAFWKKLRGEEVRVHKVEVGGHTHEGRGAMGRQIVQALMGDAPRVTVHNQDAQVDIYVNRASVEKTLSYGGSKNIPIEVSKAILLQTKEMLADAKYIGSHENYATNSGLVHYFVSAAQTGDEIRRVVYMAHETEGRSGSHLYVEEVELLDTENTGANDTSRPRFPAGAQHLTSNHPGTISIPELLQNYNTEFLRRYDLKERGAKRALQYSLREERTGVFTEIADRELREAGIDGRTARKAAERLGFGTIEFGKERINKSLNYMQKPGEIAAFSALPRVLKRGKNISGHANHKGRGFGTETFAAPVTINGVMGYMAVVVKREARIVYKTHRILMPDGSTFVFNEKAEPTPANRGSQKRINPAPISSATNSIPQVEENSNTNKNFSLKNVDTDMTETQRVVEENERLQKLVGSLNAQLRAMRDGASGKSAVDRKAVWALAREMKAQYQSKVRVNDLGANLQKAFDAMANARTDTEGKSAMEAMAAIARDMLDKSENIDSTMYDEYADLRGYLRKGRFRLTDAQWAEAAKLYGSEKEFRKAVKGRWGVAGKRDRSAGSFDAVWVHMHAKWPGMGVEKP